MPMVLRSLRLSLGEKGSPSHRNAELMKLRTPLEVRPCDSPMVERKWALTWAFREPEMGFEPMTPRLRIACSAELSYSGARSV